MYLQDYGFTPFFERALADHDDPALAPARVVAHHGGQLSVVTADGFRDVRLSGRVRHRAATSVELPTVGDWVGLRGESVEIVLPRASKLSRKVPGRRTDEQIVAANVDFVWVVMALDPDYSERRLERYLVTVWESGATPIVLLNKSDLSDQPDAVRARVEALAEGATVLTTSARDGDGLEAVRERLVPRSTSVLVGSSGVGKSTLINRLLGDDRQATRELSPRDARGQHTTTHRELFRLRGGALLIDSPGIRELQLWADEEALDHGFDDIAGLAAGCRYADCAHDTEPGCAVVEAVRSGSLGVDRLESFRSLQKELRYLSLRQDESAKQVEKQKWRAIHKEMRRSGRHRRT